MLATAFLALGIGVRAPCAASARGGGMDIVLLVDTSESMKGFGKHGLSTFVEDSAASDRIGLVTFGEEAAVLHPLASVEGARKEKLVKAVGSLAFDAQYKDLNTGLALALAQLRLHGRDGVGAAVVLMTNGHVEPSPGDRPKEEILTGLRNDVLYAYLLEEIPVHAVAFGDADLELMQEIGSSTRGRCLVAPDAMALHDTLSVLRAGLAAVGGRQVEPDAEGEVAAAPAAAPADQEREAGFPAYLVVAAGGVAALVLVTGMLVLALLLVNTVRLNAIARSQPPSPKPGTDATAFAGLRKKANRITKLLMEARSSLEGFNVDLEDYAAESWENEKDLRNRYYSLASGLFLLRDHLEIQDRGSDAQVGIEWLVKRVSKTLEVEGIAEIPVKPGDRFDGMYHKHAGDRADGRPAGSVVEVARKGYFVRHGGTEGEDLILRHAEVVVSTGRGVKKAG